MRRRKYDREFKQNAVELLLSSGRDLKPLARELGICAATLREWRDRYLGELNAHPDGSSGELTPRELAEELRRLRKENQTLLRQREILKKALGIVSEQSPGGMP